MSRTSIALDGSAVCSSCELADSFASRFRGLMLRAELPAGEGLLIRPTGSVHTCFMRFPIDVVFLDRDLRVVKIAEGVRPWRLATARQARAVLELPAGEAAARGVTVGAQLTLAGAVKTDG